MCRRSTGRRPGSLGTARAKEIRGRHVTDAEAKQIVDDHFPQFKERVKQRYSVSGEEFEELFWADAEARKNLDLLGGECVCLDAETIAIGPRRTRSAVIEELIHAEQNHLSARGMTRVSPSSAPREVSKFEAVAAELQIRGAREWRIPEDETGQISEWLAKEVKRLKGSDLEDVRGDVVLLAGRLGV